MKLRLPLRIKIAHIVKEAALCIFARMLLLFGLAFGAYTAFISNSSLPLSIPPLLASSPLEGWGFWCDQQLHNAPLIGIMASVVFFILGICIMWSQRKSPKILSILLLDTSNSGSIAIHPEILEKTILQGFSSESLPQISSIEISSPEPRNNLLVTCIFAQKPTATEEISARNSIETSLREIIGFQGELMISIQYFEE